MRVSFFWLAYHGSLNVKWPKKGIGLLWDAEVKLPARVFDDIRLHEMFPSFLKTQYYDSKLPISK